MDDFPPRSTRVLLASDEAISEAADILRAGGLVAFPTETVYGLGAAAENPQAVRSIFAAKGRPADHPVIVHLADVAGLEPWAAEFPRDARRLAEAFWPGPLTLILRRSKLASDLVTGGMETVGLRVPSHPVAQRLLRTLGGAIAAPSANRFGRVSPTTAEHVRAELDGRVDLILDGGPCSVGLESTIVDLSQGRPAILRPGAITAEQIEQLLAVAVEAGADGRTRVSGSLPSHYAPRARVEIVRPEEISRRAEECAARGLRVAVLALAEETKNQRTEEPKNQRTEGPIVRYYALPSSEIDLARHLYALLRQVDDDDCDVALATLPVETGIGAAIADRLRKAAGPRPVTR